MWYPIMKWVTVEKRVYFINHHLITSFFYISLSWSVAWLWKYGPVKRSTKEISLYEFFLLLLQYRTLMVLKLCCKSFLAFAESNYLVSCFTFVFLYLRFYMNHCKSPVLKYTLTTLECIAILHNLLGSVTMYNSTLFCKRFRASFRCVLAKKSYCIF